MSERTSEKISAGMREQIDALQSVDFEEKARKILSRSPLLSAQDV